MMNRPSRMRLSSRISFEPSGRSRMFRTGRV
jgi:hypothetical protein